LLLHTLSGIRLCHDEVNEQYISRIFAKTAHFRPNNYALIVGDVIWTYSQLLRESLEIASLLVHVYGVRPNTFVMLMIPKTTSYAFSCMLGVLLAGACYIPVDSEKCPIERAAYIYRDAKCILAIVGSDDMKEDLIAQETESEFPFTVLSTFDVDNTASDTHAAEAFSVESIARDPDDACYIIYTSGTTGKPKGVVVSQSNIANLVLAEKKLFMINQEDRVYQNFSHSFDFSLEEIWMAWSAGAALV
jgi:non-ribosomal peptide synthetase component F